MKYTLSILSILFCTNLFAQVSYKDSLVTHDTTFNRMQVNAKTNEVCKGFWFWKTCKPVTTLDTTYVPVFVKDGAIHDSLVPVPVQVPLPVTSFGAKIQQDNIQNQIAAAKALGAKCIRPNGVVIKDYKEAPKNLIDFYNAGFFCIINVSWVNTAGDNIVPFLTAKDTAEYKRSFEQFCKESAKYIGIICIENEPINRKYYSGPISDYITQLRISVEIAHKYGIKITDGCVHLELVNQVQAGNIQDSRVADTKALLTAEKTIPVDYTNVHTSYEKDRGGFKCKDIPGTVNYIQMYTSRSVMANEYSFIGITCDLLQDFVSYWREAQVVYAMAWSGDGWDGEKQPTEPGNSKGDALNRGASLTTLGDVYREAITE